MLLESQLLFREAFAFVVVVVLVCLSELSVLACRRSSRADSVRKQSIPPIKSAAVTVLRLWPGPLFAKRAEADRLRGGHDQSVRLLWPLNRSCCPDTF